MAKKDLTVYFISSISVLLLAFFYALLASHFFPEGINLNFVERLWKRLMIPFPFIILGLIVYLFLLKNRCFSYTKDFEKIESHDWFFAIVPMIPIVRYVMANQDWLNYVNSFLILFGFAIVSAILCVFVPALLSFFSFKYFLMAISTSFLFTILNMPALAAHYNWHQVGELHIKIIAFAALFLVLALSRIIPRKLVSTLIIIIFSANMLMAFSGANMPQHLDSDINDLPLVKEIRNREIKRFNNILLIVYEAYANYETILHYGSDNSKQLAFLEDKGFHIYHSVYTLGTPTTAAMSRLFNLDQSLIDRKYPAGGGAVQNLLRKIGYESHSIFSSDYMFRNLTSEQISCDNPFPPLRNEALTMIDVIIQGEFSDELSFADVGYETYLERKNEVLTGKHHSPLIMYSHSPLPGHGPSGQGVDPEESPKYMDRYTTEWLPKANDEMRQDVNLVLENNPDAIVIIAGDHGPFLTKDGYGLNRRGNFEAEDIDRYDLQDRFGAFLAIRWPKSDYATIHDIKILQDIFPAVFAYLYDDESLFDLLRMERITLSNQRTLGVKVDNGIIVGGKHDGEPLFLYTQD